MFKRSAVLAALIMLALIGGYILQGLNSARETKKLRAQINDIYTEIYPGQDIPENPVSAVMRAQSNLKHANKQEFVTLSALLTKGVQKVKGVEIMSLRYDQSKGQLALSVRYSSFDDVERLKKAITQAGGLFSENGTRQNGDGLSGDAVLRLKP